jgi:PPOX class probable F420-dependent enzyme
MDFSDEERAFLEQNHSAAMITLRPDGTPHAVRCGVALVEGKLWSSGVPGRARTRHLRRDPRATVFVFDARWAYVSIESRARIIEGPQGAEMNLRLFQVMQAARPDPDKLMWNGKELPLDEFLEAMRAEQRLIYEFEPQRTYGLLTMPGTRS